MIKYSFEKENVKIKYRGRDIGKSPFLWFPSHKIIIFEINILMNIPTHREPSHPGEILREEYLIPLGITQATLAKDLEIPYQRINEILNKKRGITPSTALRLASYFKTTPDFWMNLQMRLDMYHAMKKEGKLLDRIQARVSS